MEINSSNGNIRVARWSTNQNTAQKVSRYGCTKLLLKPIILSRYQYFIPFMINRVVHAHYIEQCPVDPDPVISVIPTESTISDENLETLYQRCERENPDTITVSRPKGKKHRSGHYCATWERLSQKDPTLPMHKLMKSHGHVTCDDKDCPDYDVKSNVKFVCETCGETGSQRGRTKHIRVHTDKE
jgi:hypothetical protein